MIHLNLLPPEQQQRLRTQAKLIRWRGALVLVVVMMLLGNGVLAGTQMYLEQHQKNVETDLLAQQTAADTTEAGALTQTTKRINSDITMLSSALPTARSWAHDLALLADKLPPNIRLSELELTITNSVTIAGIADTRSDFLVLDEFLRTHPNLTNIQTESQASQREDLPFQYTATWITPAAS